MRLKKKKRLKALIRNIKYVLRYTFHVIRYMYILGLSAFYHDSAAVLLKDGEVVCGMEEERLSRIKHDNNFPFQAVAWCLKNAGIAMRDIDYIAYYEKPLLKFERILHTFVETYPFSLQPFLKGIPEWINQKIKIEQIIRKELGFGKKLFFIPHHVSHAAAAFYTSSYVVAAIATIDGVGEYQTTALWYGNKNTTEPLQSIHFPHSLGLLYSTFTAFLGFKVNEDEYKVMGLAAYGKPIYIKNIYRLIDVKKDGSFRLDISYFSYRENFQMWSKKFEALFGLPRKPFESVTQTHKNIAASIQTVTEEIYFQIFNHLYDRTKTNNLCVSGGVGLNALANGKIYKNTSFKNIHVFGAAGDSGGALGCALYVYHALLKKERKTANNHLYFGSEYSGGETTSHLRGVRVSKTFKNKKELVKEVAQLLAENKIIGWFQGKMEFGPRALGSRSILANPKQRFMKEKVNRIKIRELFRPFAGSILQEHVHEYFHVPEKNHNSPFMTFCFTVKTEKRNNIAAIVHADNTCRIQTVNTSNGLYYELIREFYRITGIPCILDTSFNLKGEPIVENPQQAIEDFYKTKMDALVIGNDLIIKT